MKDKGHIYEILQKYPSEDLEITLGSNPGTVEGLALDRQGQPAVNVTVALTPDPPLRNRTDLYMSTQTDALGRFQLQNIAPGGYKLFAWEEVEPGAWQDANFMRAYEDLGKSVRVSENSNQVIDAAVSAPRLF